VGVFLWLTSVQQFVRQSLNLFASPKTYPLKAVFPQLAYMKQLLLFIVLAATAITAQADHNIRVKINKFSFAAKDTIQFSCVIPEYSKLGLAAATLNVWIQDVDKQQTWKYRYPILNGECEGTLAIGDSIKPGKYAINFVVQSGLFKVYGNITSAYNEKTLNYLMMVKGKKSYFGSVEVQNGKSFLVKNVLFEDDASFLFSPTKKGKANNLMINVTTPLDSVFTPLAVFSQVVDIKPELYTAEETRPRPTYKFDFDKAYANTTLPDVIVYSKGKKKVEQYDAAYSTALFQGGDARIFDGLENDDIANSIDIETFLTTRVPGLRLVNTEPGQTNFVWRGLPVTVYIDEFRLEEGDAIFVTPYDVAMIKVYSPPASVNTGGGGGGAIAIYTKRGNFDNNPARKYRFTFKGYTALDSVWK